MIQLAAIDYSIFPPINATLNGLATVLLLVGFVLIKSGRPRAHRNVMIGALVSSAVFLVCYLVYHYGTGHTEFPKAYPVARKIYFAILIPHIVLAVVNVPLIIILVLAAARGRFERHKKFARVTYPSWLFVSVTGVIIYFMIYVWFPPPSGAASGETASGGENSKSPKVSIVEASARAGDLVFTPASQALDVEAEEERVDVTFDVENRGDEPVAIQRLESGCECLEVSVDVNPVPAGGRATITGVFDVTQLRGSAEKAITVATGQQTRPVHLVSRLDINPLYTIEKSMTSWEIGEEPGTKVVRFRVKRDEPIRVLEAESKRKEVACELVEVEPGRAYDLKLTPRSTDSHLLGIVRIETDCEIERYARPLAYFSIQ